MTGVVSLALVSTAALAWQECFLFAYHAWRLDVDPRLKQLMVELRREFTGSAPLRAGDGVPLPPRDARADWVRKLLADPWGSRILTRELLSERSSKRSACTLHGMPLRTHATRIAYGLIYERGPYFQARDLEFPFAAYCKGGCLGETTTEALVLSCRSCDAAEEAWRLRRR